MPTREPTGQAKEFIIQAKEAARQIRLLGHADASLLKPIITAVLVETARNRFPSAALLAALTADYPEARAAVATLAADPHAHIRRRALRCLGQDSPREFAAELLRSGLTDPDAGVRMKAASVAGFLGLENLVNRDALVDPRNPSDDVV